MWNEGYGRHYLRGGVRRVLPEENAFGQKPESGGRELCLGLPIFSRDGVKWGGGVGDWQRLWWP